MGAVCNVADTARPGVWKQTYTRKHAGLCSHWKGVVHGRVHGVTVTNDKGVCHESAVRQVVMDGSTNELQEDAAQAVLQIQCCVVVTLRGVWEWKPMGLILTGV